MVVTESGRTLGAIADVVANPANDLWVTVDEAGTETLVPAIREVVVDTLECTPLQGAADVLLVCEDRFQELALGAVPGGDLLADLAVQLPEVLFDLAEIREEVLGQGGQLLEMVQCFGACHDAYVAVPDPLHLGVDPIALPLQFGEPHLGIGLRLLDQPLQDGKDAGEPGLGGHEVASTQALHPADNVFRGRGEIVAGLVLALDVVLPQPGPFGRGPVV